MNKKINNQEIGAAIGLLFLFQGFMLEAYADPIIWPIIGEKIGIGHSYTLALTISGACSAATTPIATKCITIMNSKKLLVFSAAAATILCAAQFSIHSLSAMIFLRCALGITLAFALTAISIAIGTIFPPQKRGFWIGLQGTLMGVASIITPPLTGFLMETAYIGIVFFAPLPFSVIGIFLILKYMIHPDSEEKRQSIFDFKGAFFILLCLASFFVITSKNDFGLSEKATQCFIFLCILSAIAFFCTEKRIGDHGILPFSLFKNHRFIYIILASFFASSSTTALYYSFSYYMLIHMQISPWETGLAISLQFLVALFFSPFLGKYIKNRQVFLVAIYSSGILMIFLYLYLILFLSATTPLWKIHSIMILFGIYAMVVTVASPYIAQNFTTEQQRPYTIGGNRLANTLGYCVTLPLFTAILNHWNLRSELGYDIIYLISILATLCTLITMHKSSLNS